MNFDDVSGAVQPYKVSWCFGWTYTSPFGFSVFNGITPVHLGKAEALKRWLFIHGTSFRLHGTSVYRRAGLGMASPSPGQLPHPPICPSAHLPTLPQLQALNLRPRQSLLRKCFSLPAHLHPRSAVRCAWKQLSNCDIDSSHSHLAFPIRDRPRPSGNPFSLPPSACSYLVR